jgi:hypothetical protein
VQADGVQKELSNVQQKNQLAPVDGSYNAATLRFIGITQLPPDDKVGGREVSVDGAFPSTYAHVMSSSTATDIITDGLDDKAQVRHPHRPLPLLQTSLAARKCHFPPSASLQVAKTPLVPTPKLNATPKRRFNPMASMDAQTPLTPRTRLILGIGPDPNTPTVATELPNALFGSMEPGSPIGSEHPEALGGDPGRLGMQDQVHALQADLLMQKHKAEAAARHAEEAKHETAQLRDLISTMQAQMQGMHAGGGASSSAVFVPSSASSQEPPGNIGLIILDVLGLLWLVAFFQGLSGGQQAELTVAHRRPFGSAGGIMAGMLAPGRRRRGPVTGPMKSGSPRELLWYRYHHGGHGG